MKKIFRVWDNGKNKVRFVYRNELDNLVLGEEKFEWFFYVKIKDFEDNKEYFKKLINQNLINKYEYEKNYVRIFVDREHNSESLTIDNEFCWEYKDKILNIVLSKLNERGIKHFEADVKFYTRWVIANNIQYDTKYKILFLDIETNDENIKGQPIPGEFNILSCGFLDGQTGTRKFVCAKDETEQAEKELLTKMAKIINAYDVIVGFNSRNFDEPYIKVRFARYGIKIDWRKKFWQDHREIFMKHGQGFISYSLDYIAKKIVKRGKVERSERIIDLFRNNKNKLEEYNLEDVQLMYDIEKATKYLSIAREMNTLGMMPCDDIYISRKIDMLILRQAFIDENYHFPSRERHPQELTEEEKEEQFEGAFVLESVLGRHERVKTVDFAQTYPSIIRTFNISPDTYLYPNEKYDLKEDQIINHPTGTKFRKDYIGILPKVVTMIQEERKKYKNMMKTVDPESEEHKTFDRLQYAWKAYGLSFYGCVGNKHARIYEKNIAESVTLGGQFFIKNVMDYFRKNDLEIIAGDSDSAFIKSKCEININALLNNVNKICAFHAKKFNCDKSYLEMSYDKGFHTLIITCKKRYAGMVHYLDDKELEKPSLYIKGLEYIRTDTCPFVRKKQEELLHKILRKENLSLQEARDFVLSMKNYVFSKQIDIQDFVFGQKLTKAVEEYKSNTMHLKVVEEMYEDNKEVWIGDKILYFIESMDQYGKPVPKPIYKYQGIMAREYVWNKKIFPAFFRILRVVFPDVNWKLYMSLNQKQLSNSQVGRMDLW